MAIITVHQFVLFLRGTLQMQRPFHHPILHFRPALEDAHHTRFRCLLVH